MKRLVVFLVILVEVYGSYIAPGQITAQKPEGSLSRVAAGGKQVNKGEFLDFCYISVVFAEKYKNCGCVIYDEMHVVTSARCVVDCSEGVATNVTVTFPFISGKDSVIEVVRIYYPDGYDVKNDDKFTFAVGNNALLKLGKKIKIYDKMCSCKKGKYPPATITTVVDLFVYIKATIADVKYKICGVGAKHKVECVDIIIINPETGACPNPDGSNDPFTPPEGYFCFQLVDGTKLSPGDYGGPIYAYTTKQGPNGPVIVVESVTIVGFAIGGFFIEIVHIEWIETILKLRSELKE